MGFTPPLARDGGRSRRPRRWREGFDVDRGLGVQVVAVRVETVVEVPAREDPEVEVDHGQVRHVPEAAQDGSAQTHQDEESHREGHPDELREIALEQRPHPDVVV
jgi:hypothetical protein